jgi:nicotinate-nucleotide adenylyltransferase
MGAPFKRLGLFGGTFDPVHLGHLMMAEAALEEAHLDRIFFIPAARSPFKPERAPLEDRWRVALLELALAGRSGFELDFWELERGGVSYTIDTVERYAAKFPGAELFYIIGQDHVSLLPQWRDAERLSGKVRFLAVPRPGEQPVLFPPGFRGEFLKGRPVAVSSSDIRRKLSRGELVGGLVPQEVAKAIANNGLYL